MAFVVYNDFYKQVKKTEAANAVNNDSENTKPFKLGL